MKILLLSFYYKPDLCAGSFRCTALVEKLRAIPGVEIELVTTLPNRYASFSTEALEFEEHKGLKIHRIPLPKHDSGMLDQAKAFCYFYFQTLKIIKNERYDGVYATSSRLFTAFLGARISRKKRLPLYLDIRDIFVDTVGDVLSPKVTWFAKPIFSMLESYSFSRAGRINLVSKGFQGYFESKYTGKELRWFTNGIDQEFINASPINNHITEKDSVLTVLYAGNIGEGQGLHAIIPAMAKRFEGRARFVVVGDGGRRDALLNAVKGQKNVEILEPMGRSQLIEMYKKADILFLHLNNYAAFQKVLPSKIFEYAALGKPICAGVSGFSASFLEEEVSNCAVFSPGNVNQAEMVFQTLNLRTCPREDFISKFSREVIMTEMASDIVSFIDEYSSQ